MYGKSPDEPCVCDTALLSFVCTQISRRTHRIQTSQDTFTGCISMNIYM